MQVLQQELERLQQERAELDAKHVAQVELAVAEACAQSEAHLSEQMGNPQSLRDSSSRMERISDLEELASQLQQCVNTESSPMFEVCIHPTCLPNFPTHHAAASFCSNPPLDS